MLVSRVPPRPLSRFVQVLWYAEGWKPAHARERHMPDGTAGLIISLSEPGSAADHLSVITGPRSTSSFIDTSEVISLVGAQFTGAGAAAFLDVPVSLTANQIVSIRDACRAPAASLRVSLLDAPTPHARLDVLETWLTEGLLRQRLPEPSIAWAAGEIRRRPHTRIQDVAAQVGRSSRWFIEHFARDVGLTPKVFSRVQRFQHALREMYRCPKLDLAEIASAAGYFDQAHFTHEFRSIADITPTAYVAGRTQHHNHVALTD